MSEGKNHSEQFERYLRGELSPQEAHAFERESLDDPFTEEALEGYTEQGTNHLDDITILKNQIIQPKGQRKLWWQYASVAAILFIASYFIFLATNQLIPQPQLSSKEETIENQPSPLPKRDTLSITEKSTMEEVFGQNEEKMADMTENETIESDEKEASNYYLAENEQEEVFFESDDEQFEVSKTSSNLTNQIAEIDKIELVQDSFSNQVAVAESITLSENIFSEDTSIDLDINPTEALQGRVAGVRSYLDSENENSQIRIRGASSLKKSKRFAGPTVSGTVTDVDGAPLPGATVLIQGTSNGTITDIDGNFELEVGNGQTLTVDYIGYSPSEVKIRGKDSISIALTPDFEALQEVVVVGYGESTKSETSYTPATPKEGRKSYKTYLEENLNYPESAEKNKIEGTVVLLLSISSSGAIEDITVKKSLGYGCDEEAIRLIEEGPKWNPANRNGSNEEDEVRIKVKFKL